MEIMKEVGPHLCHVAIRVSNFEEACKYLSDRGVELEEPKAKNEVKSVFLKSTEKAGNRIRLLYTA